MHIMKKLAIDEALNTLSSISDTANQDMFLLNLQGMLC